MKLHDGLACAIFLAIAAPAAAAEAPLCVDVETMIADMGINDAPGRGINPNYGWSRQAGANTAVATWSRQPDWWTAENAEYAGTWPRILPWFVIFEGADSPAVPVDIQVGRMAIRYLSRSDGTWHVLDSDASWEVSMCDPGGNYVDCRMVTPHPGRDGLPAFTNGGDLGNGHGWFEMLDLPDPYDVKSLSVSIAIRKVGDMAERASVLAHVGADFYPAQGRVPGANPGAGLSKMKRIGSEWTVVTMTVLHELTGNDTGVTVEELRRSPPACPAAN